MMDSKIRVLSQHLFWVTFILLFALYLRSELSGNYFIEANSSLALLSVSLVILCVIYILLFRHFSSFTKGRLEVTTKRIAWFFCVFYFSSLALSPFSEFDSRSLYFLLVVPLLGFIITRHIFVFVENSITVRISLILVFVYLVFLYFQNYQTMLLEGNRTASNTVYILLVFLPMLLCNNRILVRSFALIIVAIAIILSFKRTGALAFLAAVLSYFYYKLFYLKGKRVSLSAIITVALIVFVSYFVITRVSSSTDDLLFNRMSAMQEDEGSGRIDVWRETVSSLGQSSIRQLMVGHGYDAVRKATSEGLSAHNDFLEVLFDFGIVGSVFYLAMVTSLIRFGIYLSRKKSLYTPAYWASFWIFITMSLFSHIVIYPWLAIIQVLSWSYILSLEQVSDNSTL